MTDNEIIKALEICNSNALIHNNKRCTDCKYNGTSEAAFLCFEALEKDALDLIKRQKAEIERLKELLKSSGEYINNLEKNIGV